MPALSRWRSRVHGSYTHRDNARLPDRNVISLCNNFSFVGHMIWGQSPAFPLPFLSHDVQVDSLSRPMFILQLP